MVSVFHQRLFKCLTIFLALVFVSATTLIIAQDRAYIVLASTTSTEQTGLFKYLLEHFEPKAGFNVRVVAVGTGQALDIARRGDADLVLVHDRELEEKFVVQGFGIDRRNVMYNDFVLVGPVGDPANAATATSASEAMRRIASTQAPFVSRGDRSGTHAAELRLWREANIGVSAQGQAWYRDTGSGMGQTLNVASSLNAYTLADRGSWTAFKNRAGLKIVSQGDPSLRNQYGIILVNPQRHPHVKQAHAAEFANWLTSNDGQRRIESFKIHGEALFFPNSPNRP